MPTFLVTPIVNGKLTAKQFFTPAKATAWQDSYAAKTNLARGISSEVQHQAKRTLNSRRQPSEAMKKAKNLATREAMKRVSTMPRRWVPKLAMLSLV